MLSKIALFINGDLGVSILNVIQESQQFDLKAIVINSIEKQSAYIEKRIIEAIPDSTEIIPWNSLETSKLIEKLSKFELDFAVSALFGHIIPKSMIETVQVDFINLHPSYLPIGRGAHPIPWGILNSDIQGITIHKMTEKLDSGEIYIQEALITDISMSAADIYDMAKQNIVQIFKNFIPQWIAGNFQKKPQDEMISTSHKTFELEKIRTILADEKITAEEFVRRIQALDFRESGSAIYLDRDGKKWSLRLHIEEL